MLESARDKGEEFVSEFRRSLPFSNYGLADHIGSLIKRYQADKESVDHQLANMNGRLETRRRQQRREAESRQARLIRMAEDEDLILGDELHELKLGRMAVESETDPTDAELRESKLRLVNHELETAPIDPELQAYKGEV